MNSDFFDMLSALSAAGAEFLVVGAYALAAHGLPRATGDIDIWVRPEQQNATRVLSALKSFGAPLRDLDNADLIRKGTVFQIGVIPGRIDLLTSIDGVEFDEAWPGRIETRIGSIEVPVIGREALLKNKLSTGRDKDLLDARWLQEKR